MGSRQWVQDQDQDHSLQDWEHDQDNRSQVQDKGQDNENTVSRRLKTKTLIRDFPSLHHFQFSFNSHFLSEP